MKKLMNIIKTIFLVIVTGAVIIATVLTGYVFTIFTVVFCLFAIIYFTLSIKSMISKNVKQSKKKDYYSDYIRYCNSIKD